MDLSLNDPTDLFEERYRGRSFLADYEASRPAPTATKLLSLDGDWSGLAFCPSGVYPMTASINGARARVSLLAALGDSKKTTPFHGEHFNRDASVTQIAGARRTSLLTITEDSASASKGRDLGIELVLDPAQDTLAFGTVYEQLGTRRRSCSELILARSEAGNAMSRHLDTQEELAEGRPAARSSSCPEKYTVWLTENAGTGVEALQAASFKDVFGSPLLELTSQRLKDLSALLVGSCISADSRADRVRQIRLASALADVKAYQTVLLASVGYPIVDRWRVWIDEQLMQDRIYDREVLNTLLGTPTALGLTRHKALRALRADLAELSSALVASEQELELARRIEQSRADFPALLAISSEAVKRDEIDSEWVGEALNYYLDTAGEVYALTAQSGEEASFLAAWIAQQSPGSCAASNPDTCARAVRRISTVLNSRADSFAEDIQRRFDTVMAGDRSLNRLARIVSFERELALRYGAFASYEAFSRGNKKREKIRRKEQQSLADDLLEQAQRLTTAPELLALEQQYFLGNEVTAVTDLSEVLEKRLAKTQPFSAFTHGRYFNALYNLDFTRLRELDQEYLAGIKPLLLFSAAQAAKYGPLLDALAGTKPGESAQNLQASAANPTALYAVMGAYLVNYQEVYADCFDETAPVFTISKQTDFVERDSRGYELRRLEGWTSSDSYKVKRSFSKQFNALFNTVENNPSSQLLDYFLNDAAVENLRGDTVRMMASFTCDSPEITQFERGLLAYDERVRR
ncbi:MAG: hypothetical protein AAF194_02975 [Pseudomonadota bacterium]